MIDSLYFFIRLSIDDLLYDLEMKLNKAILCLEDGTYCQGWTFLNPVFSVGELVFNTGMTGYQEVITDPSYCNQIVLFTYPEIGNTGINFIDIESSKLHIKGIVAKNISFDPYNWRIDLSLVQYLITYKIPHIFGIDTRYLVRYLTKFGSMIGCISTYSVDYTTLVGYCQDCFDIKIIQQVTASKAYRYSGKNKEHIWYNKTILEYQYSTIQIVVIDFGLKQAILVSLKRYNCNIIVVSAFENYLTILSRKPDGIILTNGPGDPSSMTLVIQNVKQLVLTNIPILGICLGHQILSLALGATTDKLKFGHRGLNHPVSLLDRVSISSQNHGFVVKNNDLFQNKIYISSWNINDNTIAGIVHKSKPCFSVQYHPEASPGPHDAFELFYHFIMVIDLFR